MGLIATILTIVKMIIVLMPKVADFIETLIKSRQQGLREIIDSGVTESDIKKAQADIREDVIIKTKEEFSGSDSLIPEPIIRIIYEWVILNLFGKHKNYVIRLGAAFNRGFISRYEVLSAEEQIELIKKGYPEMFGERR